jgi:hypothetical protein
MTKPDTQVRLVDCETGKVLSGYGPEMFSNIWRNRHPEYVYRSRHTDSVTLSLHTIYVSLPGYIKG